VLRPEYPIATERLSLRPFETEVIKGAWTDELLYALLDREWREQGGS
jgi:RimJ/RimL family protein N-acetyltransferase